MSTKTVSWSEANGVYKASIDGGPKFDVGRRVSYGKVKPTLGLATAQTPGAKYDPANHASQGFWAQFIYPTAMAESRLAFHCINTYDAAFFTFSFLQFGAHVPNGDFVKYFRSVLAEPQAEDYFPDLLLHNGRIARDTPNGPVAMESDLSTESLMTYLNPSIQAVEPAEIINAAKLIHWTEQSPRLRDIQVETGIGVFRSAMRSYSKRYNLDQRLDKVCLMVADIRHQGRAKSDEILAALQTNGNDETAYRNLLKLGSPIYQGRLDTLDREIKKLVQSGVLGARKYDQASSDFVAL